jgi:hypothetical protein
VSAEVARLVAAQAKADATVRLVADHDGGPGLRLMVAVIDPATNTRLATGFVTYETGPVPGLRLVSIAAEQQAAERLPSIGGA